MKTRAKLVCTAVTPSVSSDTANPTKYGEQVNFQTLYDDANSKEDNSFSVAAPSANFEMFVSNPEAYGRFEVGRAYYFDITPC